MKKTTYNGFRIIIALHQDVEEFAEQCQIMQHTTVLRQSQEHRLGEKLGQKKDKEKRQDKDKDQEKELDKDQDKKKGQREAPR